MPNDQDSSVGAKLIVQARHIQTEADQARQQGDRARFSALHMRANQVRAKAFSLDPNGALAMMYLIY